MNRQERRANKLPSRAVVAQRQREGTLVHTLIMDTAKGLAGVYYEKAAGKSNNFFKAFLNQNDWINTQWPDFVGEAKKALSMRLGTLAQMATDNPNGEEAAQAEIIYDALCMDRTLPKSQSRGRI